MHQFDELLTKFETHFHTRHFPSEPATLYEPGEYFLTLGGKRVRPVMALLGNELFDTIHPDAWPLASAIELFHNFTLIHDDIMDKAPLRRGKPTVHARWGEPTALLSGDVMLVAAYEQLNRIDHNYSRRIISIFNRTAAEVCEGQQLDMDFEKTDQVSLDAYLHMITLKTSVLLAASLQMGAVLGGAGEGNQKHLYEFGKQLGIAFQVQDDYLDCFGDPAKFGKQVGGDILSNKKTFLLLHALETAKGKLLAELKRLLTYDGSDKVEKVLAIYRECGVDAWARELKDRYVSQAEQHLEDIAVINVRKQPLRQLAGVLVQREK